MKRLGLMKFAGFTTGAAALAGCTLIGPTYEAPDISAYEPEAFINNDGYDNNEALSAWWTRFEDDKLNELISLGLAENRELGAAYANVNIARAQWGLARLNRAPFDTITSSYLESRTGSAVFIASTGGSGANPFPTNDISDINVAATWEVDLFGRVTRTINIGKANLGEAQYVLADLQTLIISDIADAYINLRGLQAQRAVALNNVANQDDTLKLTEVRRDAGRGTDLDVERAKSQLAGTRAIVPPLDAAIKASLYQLGVLTGQSPAQINAIVEDPAPLPMIKGAIPIGDPAAFLRRRPDIAASEQALAAATEQVGLDIAEAFPRIDLTGQVGYQAVGFQDQFSSKALNFATGPSITWSLTNLLRARKSVQASRAGIDAAFNTYENTVLSALAEAETAFANQALLQEQLIELVEAERASREAARLARLRYENGAEDFLSVLDAERRDLEAADALAAVRTATAQSQVAVFRALRAGPTQD
ncbi:MAG: TolC family protein [Pseudomonadota bacterium]